MLTRMDMDDDLLSARHRVRASGPRTRELREQLAQMKDGDPTRADVERELRAVEQDGNAALVTVSAYVELGTEAASLGGWDPRQSRS